eukprot:1157756-Pelagomonas_calceolata.AAC.2
MAPHGSITLPGSLMPSLAQAPMSSTCPCRSWLAGAAHVLLLAAASRGTIVLGSVSPVGARDLAEAQGVMASVGRGVGGAGRIGLIHKQPKREVCTLMHNSLRHRCRDA